MSAKHGETVICLYHVKSGSEKEFEALLRRHWSTLKRLGTVTDEPSQVYRGVDGKGRPTFWEIFTWKSPGAFQKAHTHPDVLAIWEPMDMLCEPRDGRPNMEFPHVERLEL